MAILAYVGLMGDGKSYGVVENVIIKNLRLGRVVWSNIPMVADELEKEIPGHKFHQIESYDKRWESGEALADIPKGTITVLDELWTVLPAGMKATKVPAPWKHFIAEHRHEVGEDGFTSEIVFVTQDLADIAAFARNKVQRTFMVRKLWMVGAENRFIVDIYRGAISGQRGPESCKMGTAQGVYRPEVYKLYVSHTKGGGKIGHEAVADKRGVIWRHPMIMFGIPLAALAVIAAVYFGYAALQGITGQDERQAVAAGVPARLPATARVVVPSKGVVRPAVGELVQEESAPVDLGTRYSKRWRVAAVIVKEAGDGLVLLIDESQLKRLLRLAQCEKTGPLPDDIGCMVDGFVATTFTGVNAGWIPNIVKNPGKS